MMRYELAIRRMIQTVIGLTIMFSGVSFPAPVSIPAGTRRYVRIGELQNHYAAYGSDRAWNNSYYEGLQWPASYPKQDNSVIRRQWIGCQEFTSGQNDYYSHFAINISESYADVAIFPVMLQQIAKFPVPDIFVNGILSNESNADEIDEIDPTILPDRIIISKVNTLMGLTITRTVYVFSQQYHNNYFIQIWNLENTGNTDYDDEIEVSSRLKGVRFSFGARYSVCREGAEAIGGNQSWGRFSWVTKRGETYSQHQGESITEVNPVADWLRCGFEFAGQNPTNSFDNLGGPYLNYGGRLAAPQHAGIAILHVDKSAKDHSDDPTQPNTLGWHAGDTYPTINSYSPAAAQAMLQVYSMISGNPYQGLGGTDRFDESYLSTHPDPSRVHNDNGGTNLWACYGPWDLEPGESVNIVEAEGVSGLSRAMCEQIGARWHKAYLDPSDNGPFILPDGSTTADENVYKNTWFFTGKDSILKTFGRAKRAYDAGLQIPQPPQPPPRVDIQLVKEGIRISWTPSPSELDSDFGGYKIFRAENRIDTLFQEIYSGSKGVHSFTDSNGTPRVSYFYFVSAFNDGSANSGGEYNPAGPLLSSRYYTMSTEPIIFKFSPPEANLYVSPSGNDSSSGLSPFEPLKTIAKALNTIATYDTAFVIHLAPGLYSPSATGEKFPLDCPYMTTIQGEDKRTTILCPEDSSWAFQSSGFETSYYALKNLTITGGKNPLGGGIACWNNSSLDLQDICISDNAGIGLYFNGPYGNLSLKNVEIRNNGAGGAQVSGARNAFLANTSITHNGRYGLYFSSSSNINFDLDARCSIYSNFIDIGTASLLRGQSRVHVVVDTFTVLRPTAYYASPPSSFIFDIKHFVEDQIPADLYVSPTGSDQNAGTSAAQPFKTLEYAIRKIVTDSLHQRTINMADGIYSASNSGENFPVRGDDWLVIRGESSEGCVLDGEGTKSGAFYCYGSRSLKVQNMTLRNFTGSAFSANLCKDLTLNHVALVQNGDKSGCGIYCNTSDPVFLCNTTIAGNSKSSANEASSGIYSLYSNIHLINSIVWANSPQSLSIIASSVQIVNSDVDTSVTRLRVWKWLAGSMSVDPAFLDPANKDYRLGANSPCIDSGRPVYIVEGDTIINFNATQYIGSAPDMGAYENNSLAVNQDESAIPDAFSLSQNYPNPFNTKTEIKYGLAKRERVIIRLYNVLGQKVAVLVDEVREAGIHKTYFDAAGLSTGIYIYRIKAGEYSAQKKMLILQ